VSAGVGVLPLACCAACPGFLARGRGWGVAVRPLGVWAGRGSVRWPRPCRGGAGGDRDQVAADGRGPGPRERRGRQVAGGAQQVVRDGRDRKPRGIGGKNAGR
jgi:hypothetical protein